MNERKYDGHHQPAIKEAMDKLHDENRASSSNALLCDACQCKARYVVGANNSCGRHVVSFVDISAGLNGGGISVSILDT